MSEEEKKAIEYWKRDISLYHYNTQLCSEHYAQIILNLIEKQQKEIEHWKAGMKIVEKDKNNHIERLEKELEQEKEKNKELETENFSLNEMKRYNKKHYISKDKIKEVFDRKIKNIGCEKAEVNYNTNDTHYKYWDCFESILLNMKKELLEE